MSATSKAAGSAHDATGVAESGPADGSVDLETVQRHEAESKRARAAVEALRGKADKLRAHAQAAEDAIPDAEAEAEAAEQAHEDVKARFAAGSGEEG